MEEPYKTDYVISSSRQNNAVHYDTLDSGTSAHGTIVILVKPRLGLTDSTCLIRSRQFEEVEEAQVRDYRRNRDKWFSGTIKSNSGPLSCRVYIVHGATCRRHTDCKEEVTSHWTGYLYTSDYHSNVHHLLLTMRFPSYRCLLQHDTHR